MNGVQIDEEEKTQKEEMLIDHSGLVKAPELKIDIAGKLGNRLLESKWPGHPNSHWRRNPEPA